MRRMAEVRAGLMGAGEEQILRGLKPARDDNNKESGNGLAAEVMQAAAGNETARRTVALPSILTQGASTLTCAGVMPKPTPVNLRRFAEMPIARKAINTIKDRVAGMLWRIEPRHGRAMGDLPNAAERIALLTENFEQPNPEDSFRSMIEQVLEDVLVGGFGRSNLT